MRNLIIRVLTTVFNAPQDSGAHAVWRISNTITIFGFALLITIIVHLCHAIICYDDWIISTKAINHSLCFLGICAFGVLGATLTHTDDK